MPLKLLTLLATCVLLAQANPQDDTESFITKEAAKELRNKLSSSIEQQDDYDEILKDIIRGLRVKPKTDQHQIFYEKKYFDYLPNEILESDDVTSEDLTREIVNPDSSSNSGDESSESIKRAKREAPVRNKRSPYQIYHVPLQHYSPFPQVSFYIPHDFFSDYYEPISVYNPPRAYPVVSNYNPGNVQQNPYGRFNPPGNFYLPPPSNTQRPPATYLPPSYNNRKPINVPQPPHNQGQDGDPNTNRVGGFEEQEHYIFDTRPIRPNNNNAILNGFGGKGGSNNFNYNNRPAQTTTTTQAPFNFDMDSFGKESVEDVEIEYAPDIQEEVSTTTRASIRRPTKKNKSQHQNSRQKKSDSESSTTMERTNISQQDLDVANNGKPNKPLSPCVEAIVSCCSRYDEIVRLPCFEAHNCNGAFFGPSPCSREIKQAAFKEVEKYSEMKQR